MIEYFLLKNEVAKIVDTQQAIIVTKLPQSYTILFTTYDIRIMDMMDAGIKITEYGFTTVYNQAIQQINLIKEL